MSDEIIIENLKLSDKDKALAFLQRAYDDNPRMSDENFWDWHYAEAPYREPENLPVWVAKSGGQIVGQVGTIPVAVNVEGVRHQAIWILDMIVAPEFRRRGLATKLVKAAHRDCPFGLVINTAAQVGSTKLLQDEGYVIIVNVPRFHKPLFPANDIREIAKFNVLRRSINLVFAPFRPRFEENKRVRRVESFDASFDALWAEAGTQWPGAVCRDAKYLDWQFIRQPQKKFEIIGYYEDGKLRGYAVLFFRQAGANGAIPKAAISDLCYHPDNPKKIVDALLREALRIAVERRAGGLVTDALDPLVEERLRSFGFWQVKNPLQFMVRSTERQDLLHNPKNWFLTRGDSDISIFENPNL
jgi:GNAT superfamily N-acetyltransferase